MASEVDYANLALGRIGDDATVSSFDPPEGSPQAEHCARFYPIARDSMLEMHAWSFATTSETLSLLAYVVDGWNYAYALPNNCLHPLQVYAPGERRKTPADPFEIEVDTNGERVLLTDTPTPTLRHILRITDPFRFSPLFGDALGWLLASMLAGPILKGETGVAATEACWKTFLIRLGQAMATDANASVTRFESTAPWIAVRSRLRNFGSEWLDCR